MKPTFHKISHRDIDDHLRLRYDLDGDDIAAAKVQIHERRFVNYAGPLCGRVPGLYEESGVRVLVTSGPQFIEPASSGDATVIIELLANLFGQTAGDPLWRDQCELFLAWLRIAYVALKNPEQYLPGQGPIFIGPVNCGKTLVQEHIITPILGGRSGDLSLLVGGETSFNKGLWAAEHWVLSDSDLAGVSDRATKRLVMRIKKLLANERQPLHGKYQDQETLSVRGRLSISGNPDEVFLEFLRHLDVHVLDKLLIFRCYAPPRPFHPPAPKDRANFGQRVRECLPVFLGQIMGMPVREELRQGRYGLKAFHHPYFLELSVADGETALVARLLQRLLSESGDGVLRDSADGFLAVMRERFPVECAALPKDAGAMGRKLSSLAQLPSWRGRLRQDGKIGPDANRNYAAAWRVVAQPQNAEGT